MRWRSNFQTILLLFSLCISAIPWGSADEVKVLVCISPSAVAFHTGYCSGMNRCTYGSRWVTISEAKMMGRRPCKLCYSDIYK